MVPEAFAGNPLAAAGTVIKIGTRHNYYAPNSYTTTPDVFKELEQRTGVTVQWDVAAYADYNDAMTPRIAAGQDLPDFYRLPDGLDVVQLGLNGAILPLNDLIEQNAPNITKNIFEAFPLIKKLLTAPDGNIYNLTQLIAPGSYADPYGLLLRQDWLDKVGLAEPSTLDDWYNTLSAFKTENASGSGKGDEIPMVASNGLTSLGMFGNALGLHIVWGGQYPTAPDDAGKLIYEFIDPRYQQLLAWLNKLYSEGLLDPEWYKSDERGAPAKSHQQPGRSRPRLYERWGHLRPSPSPGRPPGSQVDDDSAADFGHGPGAILRTVRANQ